MRGTPNLVAEPLQQDGIIPAYAGNTISSKASWTARRDHPRVCGEHPADLQFLETQKGSSPRMRGTPTGNCMNCMYAGIIPAYAGNTISTAVPSPLTRDHPRVCGEHIMALRFAVPSLGSSPRMRGTLPTGGTKSKQGGIIPAYAGNTGYPNVRPCAPWDHPRVCGEHPNRT